jgi:carbamoyltransferase
MNILGISGGVMQGNQDAAAALLVDGKLIFAQEEERFSRLVHAVGALPERAVAAALAYAGLNIRQIDYVAFHTANASLRENLSRYFHYLFGYCPPLRFVNHHVAHAASAYYASGYDEAMVLTTDLSGDGISTTLSYGKGTELRQLRTFTKPQSLGIFYSIATQVLGFRRDSDEYKVMGMAAYGKPTRELDWLLEIDDDGSYRLRDDNLVRLSASTTNPSKQEPLFSDLFVERVGFLRHPGEPFTQEHFDFAASVQETLNRAAISLVRWLHRETGSRNLCVAGGVGLNCVMNQKLLELPEVSSIFVQPASSDAGAALGAAYVVAVDENESLAPFPGACLGNEFSNAQMRAQIENLGVPFREVSNPTEMAADAIAAGKIVGWFNGRHEFGPRALGSRSILADPRREEMKDLINIRVKYREEFRPFAPSALEEKANQYFAIDGHRMPYMTITCNVKEDRQADLPAVVHVDGTSRVQTVNREQSPVYHELISLVEQRTGLPAVLNTSYNVKGQPIVNTPVHAVETFYGSGMDMAVIGPFVLEK